MCNFNYANKIGNEENTEAFVLTFVLIKQKECVMLSVKLFFETISLSINFS